MLRSTSTLSRLADVFSRGAASRGAVAGIDYLFPGPNEREHESLASVGRPFAQAQRSFAADAAEGEEHEMDSGDEADADGHPREHHVVEGRERSLDDYEQLIGVLARRRRAYKIRDVFDEMDINGVNPGPMTYFRSMFACMKARRLGDTLYYWERMQHSGIQPDSRAYGVVISAAGRAGRTVQAVKLWDEMQSKGLEPSKNTYLAALNALAESARIKDAWDLVAEMAESGFPPDEFAYTSIINGYKRAVPAPIDVEEKIDELLEKCRTSDSMDFSRRKSGGLGIISTNAALNTFCELGFHERTVQLFHRMPSEGLQPDYDSYSAVIRSFLKETVRAYRQFAASHPGSRIYVELIDATLSSDQNTITKRQSLIKKNPAYTSSIAADTDSTEGASAVPQPAFVAPSTAADEPVQLPKEDFTGDTSPEVDPEYNHLAPHIGKHLTRLKKRVNLEAWEMVIQTYDEAAHKGISLSPGVYYDLMRTAVLVASTGHTEALGFAEHCLQEMAHLGMFLNTLNGSTVLMACSRRELPSGLAFAHRLWDVLVLNGRVPKTAAIMAYLRALKEREPQWAERIKQVQQVAAIDPGRLRNQSSTPQNGRMDMAQRKFMRSKKAEKFMAHGFTSPLEKLPDDPNYNPSLIEDQMQD